MGPLVFVVMDGIGIGCGDDGDAVAQANTPNLDGLDKVSAFRELKAHGRAVGLPTDGDMGNSEVGHNAIGAGRIIDQGALLVNNAILSEEIFQTDHWKTMIRRGQEGGTLHCIGLLSDGNVHSHESHLYALLRNAHANKMSSIAVHILLDGRDVSETSALIYIDRLETLLAELNASGEGFSANYRIASGGGRMVVTMDRYEADWSIVERGWRAQVLAEGDSFSSAREAVEHFREEKPGMIDQYLPPFVITQNGKPAGQMQDGDSVLFFNFRGDRALEISRAFDEDESFDKFDRGPPVELFYVGMTCYDGDYGIPKNYLVAPPSINRTMSEYLAAEGVFQYAISETQKYGHVTYFWNGNRSDKFDEESETYVEIPSDNIEFNERPEMKAAEITEHTLEALQSGKYKFLRLNYPNGDMVGHTGDLNATIKSVEVVDQQIGILKEKVEALGGCLVVTADHGNADDMFERDKSGRPKVDSSGTPKAKTSHTLAPVGLWIYPKRELRQDLPDAGLTNLAATLLQLLGYQAPEGYQPSLLVQE